MPTVEILCIIQNRLSRSTWIRVRWVGSWLRGYQRICTDNYTYHHTAAVCNQPGLLKALIFLETPHTAGVVSVLSLLPSVWIHHGSWDERELYSPEVSQKCQRCPTVLLYATDCALIHPCSSSEHRGTRALQHVKQSRVVLQHAVAFDRMHCDNWLPACHRQPKKISNLWMHDYIICMHTLLHWTIDIQCVVVIHRKFFWQRFQLVLCCLYMYDNFTILFLYNMTISFLA